MNIIITFRHWSELLFLLLFWWRCHSLVWQCTFTFMLLSKETYSAFNTFFCQYPTHRHFGQILFNVHLISFVSDLSSCFKDVFFGLFDYSKENIGKCNLINVCSCQVIFTYITRNLALNRSFLFKIDLEKYMETIQSSVSHKASLYSP